MIIEDADFVMESGSSAPKPPSQSVDDADFVFSTTHATTEQAQPTPDEIEKLKKYINFIAGERTELTLDAVVKKLADQWRAAAWKIAVALRGELRQNNSLKETDWQTKELTNAQLIEIGRSYGIPFCIYHLGTTDSSGHYVLLTSTPRKNLQTDSNYVAEAYDPIRGKIELNLTEHDLQREGKLITCIVHPTPLRYDLQGGALRLAQIDQIIAETNGYDLSVPHYDDTEELSLAKMQPLQNRDGFNCGLWCLIYAMTTMAYKRGENIFKKMGIKQIADLCQVALVTPETG